MTPGQVWEGALLPNMSQSAYFLIDTEIVLECYVGVDRNRLLQ